MLGKGGLLGASETQNVARDAFADLSPRQKLQKVARFGSGAFAPTGGLAASSAAYTGSLPGTVGGGWVSNPRLREGGL